LRCLIDSGDPIDAEKRHVELVRFVRTVYLKAVGVVIPHLDSSRVNIKRFAALFVFIPTWFFVIISLSIQHFL
jgi:hypothetical protein